jgi:excinuclease ABC subunit A
VKTADWIVDLGPEGGDRGGRIVAEGTPEEVAATKASATGEVLVPVLAALSANGRGKRRRGAPSQRAARPKAAAAV